MKRIKREVMQTQWVPMVPRRRQWAAWIIIFAYLNQPFLVLADVIADANGGANRPVMDATPNGVPVVNITTPSAGGVSRNLYTEFSINNNGVVLNNNAAAAPVSTSQGEILQQNFNLSGGNSASVILNEVTSTRRSDLQGNIEVAGSKADVVLANPNGITCNGCGFINTSRGVLTTGQPVFGGQGSLEAFRVGGGDITIGGQGLNAADTARLDLISRSLQVNGPVWANQLNAVTGNNQVTADSLAATAISTSSAAPDIGIDVASLGGMYAGKIQLISTEAGVGVNNLGEIGASVDALVIDSSGRIHSAGTLSSAGDMALSANADVNLAGHASSQGALAILAAGGAQLGATLFANQAVTVQSSNLTQTGSIVSQQNDVSLQASGSVQHSGNTAALRGAVNLNGNQVQQQGQIKAATALTVASNNELINSGALDSDHNIALTAVGTITNSGTVAAVDNLAVNGQRDLQNQSGVLYGGNQVAITVQGNLNNQDAVILSDGALTLSASTVNNGAAGQADSGIYSTANNVVVQASTAINNFGSIYARQDVLLNAAAGANTVAINNANTGVIEADRSVSLGIDCSLNGNGDCMRTTYSNGNVRVDNRGRINAARSLNVQADTFTNSIPDPGVHLVSTESSAGKQEQGNTGRYYDRIPHGSGVHDKHDGWYPIFSHDFYVDWKREWQEEWRFNTPLSADPTLMFAGTELNIRSNTGSNIGGTLAAGGDIHIGALTGNNGSFTNTALSEIRHQIEQTGLDHYTCPWNDTYCVFGRGDYSGELYVANTTTQTDIIGTPRGGIIQAGGNLYIDTLNTLSQTSVTQARHTGADTTDPANTPPPAPVPGALPTGNNGLFVQNAAPNPHYLYVSNPKLKRNVTDALSTDYLLALLGVNEDDVIRLGDALYEQRLLQDQILTQTGRAWLDDATSVEQQFSSLMDQGFDVANKLGLTMGEPLSPEQLANLDQDIVWLTTTTVNGVKALVPQLYLSSATRAGVSGGQMLAQSMVIDVNEFSNQGGAVMARADASITTQGNLENTGGTFHADNLQLTSTQGKIINQAVITRVGSADNYHDDAVQGSISATNTVQLNANAGIDIMGSTVSAGSAATLHSENGDINVQALALEHKTTEREHAAGLFYQRESVSVSTGQDKLDAGIRVGNESNNAAALSLSAANGNVNLTGADLASSGDVTIQAHDINANALHLKQQYSETSTRSGIFADDGVISMGASAHALQEQASVGSGSNISAGNGLNLQAQHDVVLEGGRYSGASGSIDAGHDVMTQAARNTYSMTETASSSGLVIDTGIRHKPPADNGSSDSSTGRSVSIGVGASNSSRSEESVYHDNSQLVFTGSATVNATHNADIGGMDATVGDAGTLAISANSISSTKFQDTTNQTASSQRTYVGISLTQDEKSVGASIGFDDNRSQEKLQQSADNRNTLQGGNIALNSNTDIQLKGVDIVAVDTVDLRANGNITLDAADSSQHYEAQTSSTHIGVNVTASAEPGSMLANVLKGNGVQTGTESTSTTQQTGALVAANILNVQAGDSVTLVGGDYLANDFSVAANAVDIVAAKSTLEQHITSTSVSFVADGSAAIGGNKAWGSYDSLKGSEAGVSQRNEHADRTGEGRVNNGKAISDELVTGKVGLSIAQHSEDTSSVQYSNVNLLFTRLDINTTDTTGSGKGDGHVDIGGANLLAFQDAKTGAISQDSSIAITSGELRSTVYTDRSETTVHDNTTFVGISSEAHSAVADTYNHSNTLANKANEGMEVDAGWTAGQAAGDASNLVFGDLAGASTSLTVRNNDTRTHSVTTAENTHFINANNINITTTQGDLSLNGVSFSAPPVADAASDTATAAQRPANIDLHAAGDVNIAAAKSTFAETTTTLTNDVNATLSGSAGVQGAGINADVGYNGSRSVDSLQQTRYQHATVNADNINISAKNVALTGAAVTGADVQLDIANNLSITSVQDTQQQSTSRSNYGGSVGAGIGTMGIVPNLNGQGGGGDSHDNYALTTAQSGIQAEKNLTLNVAGNVDITGAHIGVDAGGNGDVTIGGNVTANSLQDVHDKDGLFYGGGGGIDAAGVNVNVNLEKVDQVKYSATQNATIAVNNLQVAGAVDANLNTDANKATVVTEDRKIAGVYINASGYVPRGGNTPTKKYDSAVTVITRDKNGQIDPTVLQAANDIKKNFPDTIVVVKNHDNDGFTYQDPKGPTLDSIAGNTRIDVIGHGADLRDNGATPLAGTIGKIAKEIDANANKTDLKRVELVTCGTCAKDGNDTLGQQVAKELNRDGLTVAEHDSAIQVNKDATRTAYNGNGKTPKKLLHEVNQGKVVTVARNESSIADGALPHALGKGNDGKDDKAGKQDPKKNEQSKKRGLSQSPPAPARKKSMQVKDSLAETSLRGETKGVPPGYEGARLEATLINSAAANDAQYHVITQGRMPQVEAANYRRETGVVQDVGRMNEGRFERAQPEQNHSQVSLSRRGSIVLARAEGADLVYTRISSGATSEAIKKARETSVSANDAAFDGIANTALQSPTGKNNDIANGAKTTTLQIKQDGVTPYNVTAATSLSGTGVKSSGPDHQQVMAEVTRHNTEGRRNQRDKDIAALEQKITQERSVIKSLKAKAKLNKSDAKKLSSAQGREQKFLAKIESLKKEKAGVSHDASSDSHSEPMGSAHTNQTRLQAGLGPLEQTPTLRLVTSHDRAVCANCGKGFDESTGHRDGSLIVGEGWRPFGGDRTGFDDANSPSLFRVPPHEVRVKSTKEQKQEVAEMRSIYRYADGIDQPQHRSAEAGQKGFAVIKKDAEGQAKLKLEQALENGEVKMEEVALQAQRNANEAMFDRLLETGFDVAFNDGGRDGVDCLILSLLQHASGEYDRQHDADAVALHQLITEAHGAGEAGMLYGDGAVLADLADRLNLRVTMLHADGDGGIAMAAPVGPADGRAVLVWDQDGHFSAVHE